MSELVELTISQASELIKAGRLSPVDLTQAYLDRTAAHDHVVNSYILVLRDAALAEATAAQMEIASGRYRGPMHGIPVAIKDIFNTANVPTTGHSALFKNNVPKEDATVVKLLRDAGAVILGKTATWEFAIGGVSFDLPWPPARNPWDVSRDTAGSSSGSAAAVAAAFCAGAVGTDTAGSVRSPSAWCGLAGLKPTYGLISRRGILPLSYTLDHAGPMCWTVEDCAIMMQVLAAHDPQDPASADPSPVDFKAGINDGVKGLRVGVVRHFYEKDSPAAPVIAKAIEEALDIFRRGGASVSDATLAPLDTYYDALALVMHAEAYAVHRDGLIETPALYGQSARQRLSIGAFISGSEYVDGLRLRQKLVNQAAEVMKNFDVLITPTRNTPPQKLGDYDMQVGARIYTRPFSLLGLPALSVCSGFSPEGLPLSMQIVGRPFEDHLVLRVGHYFEMLKQTRDERRSLLPRAA
jgi:aspartyl-tRNA(Asn)/glutamyl-tRNA(Gln) amidotransferase subunit A